MTQAEYIRINEQIAVLKEVALEYSGRTIENIIQNLEQRVKEAKK